MDYRTKRAVATGILGISLAAALFGFSHLRGEVLAGVVHPLTVASLFGGAIVGIAAELARRYFSSRIRYDEDSLKTATEILAKAGKKQRK